MVCASYSRFRSGQGGECSRKPPHRAWYTEDADRTGRGLSHRSPLSDQYANRQQLVEFLHHGNTQIRQIACENLVGYSSTPSIFKTNQLLPVRDLKLLVRDYAPIAQNAITILINLSHDEEILNFLATDDLFLEVLLKKITNPKDPHANDLASLLANLAKSDSLERIFTLKRAAVKDVSTSIIAIDQLMDCFVRGAENKLNPKADYDYLSYLFADLSKHKVGREYFLARQAYDGVVPITKLTVFTEHKSHIRRKGVASTLKNVAFEISHHAMLLANDEATGADFLPYILLPLAGNEELSDEDMAKMLPDLQLLPPDKERESDNEIIITHLETLLLLTSTRDGREVMRNSGVYPIVRECHLHVEDENVREAAERVAQVLLRDEEELGGFVQSSDDREGPKEEEDEDDKIVEIF
jgi:hypothetical protein